MQFPHSWWINGPWLVFLIYWGVAALRRRSAKRRESLLSRLRYSVVWGLALFLLFSHRLPGSPLSWRFLPASPAAFFTGAGLTMVGVGFAIWARYHLGTYWSGIVMIKQDHRLIRSGPYALVRHPIYSGILLAMLGTAVAIGELRGLLAVGLALAGFVVKSRMEEKWLLQEFGAEYERYQREVKALIPFRYSS